MQRIHDDNLWINSTVTILSVIQNVFLYRLAIPVKANLLFIKFSILIVVNERKYSETIAMVVWFLLNEDSSRRTRRQMRTIKRRKK